MTSQRNPEDPNGSASIAFPEENVYGSRKRIDWLASRVDADHPAIEFGCGTGALITIPLLIRGLDAYGLDLDRRSIEFGRSIASDHGLDDGRIRAARLSEVDVQPATIIAAEVLEHISDDELVTILEEFRRRLEPAGTLLVTVPNGYGWFELESALWYRAGVGRAVERLGIDRVLNAVRRAVLGDAADDPYPNTLADDASPHVQRFTLRSIHTVLEAAGFEVVEFTGSVLFSGPFTNLLFRGVTPLLRLNCWLGDRLPSIASGFYLSCRIAGQSRGVRLR